MLFVRGAEIFVEKIFIFVGNWFIAFQCKTINYFDLKVRVDVNSWVKVTHEIHEH